MIPVEYTITLNESDTYKAFVAMGNALNEMNAKLDEIKEELAKANKPSIADTLKNNILQAIADVQSLEDKK